MLKNRFTLFFIFVLAGSLAGCTSRRSATVTPHADIATIPVESVPTLQADPATPTPEVFNPVDPSPTPPGSDLPLTCQVTDLSVSIDRAAGYCFAYPGRFAIDTSPLINTTALLGPEIGRGGDTVRITFKVEVTPYDPNQSLDQQVDAFLHEFTVVAPESLARSSLTVAGEAARMVDKVPVQLSWRLVFVPHNGQLYRLMYWPVDLPEAQADLEELYQTTLGSFAFLPAANSVFPPTATPVPQPPSLAGLDTSYGVIKLVVPPAVADGAAFLDEPRVDSADAAWWQKHPAHLVVMLSDYYVLKGKSHQAQIYVFPALSYAELVPAAFESLHRLNNYLYDPSAPVTKDQLPAVPFFNSAQVIASHVKEVAFQNGRGVRTVTWYSQGLAPVTNAELFYHYEGVTSDGEYFVVAIFPVTVPILQADATPGAAVPEGGVPMPDLDSANPDMQGYYAAVQQLLDGLQDSAFTPTLEQLDLLIQSIQIAP